MIKEHIPGYTRKHKKQIDDPFDTNTKMDFRDKETKEKENK